MTHRHRIGIDLGGTKISAIVFDQSDDVLAHKRIPTPRDDYTAVVESIGQLVDQLEKEFGSSSVGIGMPGSICPATGRVQNANSVWMNGQDFRADMESSLDRPVQFANDANCFALSEAVDGAGINARTVFGVVIGTGCGGGVVIDRQPLAGPNNIAGEWGHNPLPWPTRDEHPGPQCWCGRTGCMETWLSGSGLERDHADVTGTSLSGEEIAATAHGGDPAAKASLDRHTNRLARGLAHGVNLCDPDVSVLGGGLSNLDHLDDRLPDAMRPYVFCDSWSIEI
ncbi:MAG: ROK family protein, partial [Aestuariivirgaceae bacterium]